MTFKKGDEVLIKGTVLSFEEGEIPELEIATSENTFFVNSEDVQEMSKKVVIPNFVAEWITKKKNEGKTMYQAMAYEVKVDVFKYIMDNSEIFARAWLDGYEIEQEQLYTVKIPNPNIIGNECLVLMRNGFKQIVAVNKIGDGWRKEKAFQLTEAEIKQDFEWAWKWAKPVGE